MPKVSVHMVEEIDKPEVLSYLALLVAIVVCSITTYFIARRSYIKFKQERASSCDNASPSTLNDEILDGDPSGVHACTYESPNYDYEVFLSFRGPDTRSGFTDYLYTSLVGAGIQTYRDDEELRIGEKICPELLQAIKQSKILIPIFSERYAESKWCLMELAQMVECKNKTGQKIMPIFYKVAPAEVRYQTGNYKKAFDTHAQKRRYDDSTIYQWKAALEHVGELKGWYLKSMSNSREGELAKEVTTRVLMELKKTFLTVSNCLVEVDDKVDEIMRVIGAHSNETKIIGIHGMGGIGKTTLAKVVFNRLSHYFQHCCFLANIRETSIQNGIKCLQGQLISDILRMKRPNINNYDEGIKMIKERLSSKKVLLLLDDVDTQTQLNALMGNGDCYGEGSKVIITSRNKEILNVPQVDSSYELTGMDFNHSLQLFSRHAFRRDQPLEEYVVESKKVTNISGGLPLTLEVLGSFLYGKHKKIWDATLRKLEKIPHVAVTKTLKISFDALDNQQKNIFLDIACFFIGFDRRIVTHMWDSCDFYPEEAIEVLQQMSLIKIKDDNQLWMHDQLRDLGRNIVCQESRHKLEKQSKIWDHEQAFEVLTGVKGRKSIEAISLKFGDRCQYYFTNEEFASLPDLRFLQVENINFDDTIPHFPTEPIIMRKLRWLSWHNFPQVFNLASFSLTKLVILDLSNSKITEIWNGWNHVKMAKNLKVLNLTKCVFLQRTRDFSSLVKLERLILEGCINLHQIDSSIGQLADLVLLNLNDCNTLCELPDELGKLEALTELLIEGTCIRDIPRWTRMNKLEILNASKCYMLILPSSIGYFTSLTRLSSAHTSFSRLPDSIGQLVSLVEMDLDCSRIIELPHSVRKMKKLKVLRIGYSLLTTLPSSIGMLEKLEEIHGEHCSHLEGEIPCDIVTLPFLRILRLTKTQIESVPKLPNSLNSLWFGDSLMTTLGGFSNLSNLRDLKLFFGFKLDNGLLEDPSPWFGSLCKLESLEFDYYRWTTISVDISDLSHLKTLTLSRCKLQCLPWLPPSLSYLYLKNCWELSACIDLSNLVGLKKLEVLECQKIKEIRGNEGLENLITMSIGYATSLEKLPDLTTMKKLTELSLRNCPNVIVEGTSESLEKIIFHHCYSLEKLPDPSTFKRLKQLYTYGSKRLNDYLNSPDDWRNWIQNNRTAFRGFTLSESTPSNSLEDQVRDALRIAGELERQARDRQMFLQIARGRTRATFTPR